MSVNAPEGSSKSASTVPSGNASKASSVGANRVKGPSPDKVLTKSAAITASSNILWTSELTTISTTVWAELITEKQRKMSKCLSFIM